MAFPSSKEKELAALWFCHKTTMFFCGPSVLSADGKPQKNHVTCCKPRRALYIGIGFNFCQFWAAPMQRGEPMRAKW